MLWSALDLDQSDIRLREMMLFEWLARRPDAREGVAAWTERRPAQWSGLPSERPEWWANPPR
jgi:hypothetical protein